MNFAEAAASATQSGRVRSDQASEQAGADDEEEAVK